MNSINFVLILFILILVGLIFIYIKDINNLLIKRILKTKDYIIMATGSVLILFLTYKVSESRLHLLLGILGIVSFIMSFLRVGITTKGFRSVRGIVKGDFDNIEKVTISRNEYVKIIFVSKGIEDIQHYRLKDYDRIIKILRKNLEGKRIEIIYG
ncbi:MAG: hypothetical protein GX752_01555 [Clostridium sp.]|nr:hypothetical protein [Clostridium sp.]